jgi:hypothetical protein
MGGANPVEPSSWRCSFTLPRDQAEVLSNVAKRVGCTQSFLLSVLLEESLPTVAVGVVDLDIQPGVARRAGGPFDDSMRTSISSALESGRRLLAEQPGLDL